MIGNSLVTAFDYVWGRFTERLAGLTNDEYFWEPVAGSWSLRPDADGVWQLDGGGGGAPPPDPAPVTTIAWRVCHLAGQALSIHGDLLFGPPAEGRPPFPADVAALPTYLATNYGYWRDGIAGLDDAGWKRGLGRAWGLYADSNRVDLVLHVFDELVHHAAEVGLLRDLYGVGFRTGA